MGFKVLLKDKREEFVDAEKYEVDRFADYLFTKQGKTVAKFPRAEVVGIIEKENASGIAFA